MRKLTLGRNRVFGRFWIILVGSTTRAIRGGWRILLVEVLLLVVCGTIADCDDYEAIAAWGAAHVGFLRGYLPYHHGVPGGRWLTLLMNRINPALFSAAFMAWVREAWQGSSDFVAIDGKTSRRSHDRGQGKQALHLVSAFATASRLVLGQEAVEGKSNELTAIPALLAKLAENVGLKGALVSIDAIATNAKIAQAIVDAGADYLLAVKANQSTLRAETETAFDAADPCAIEARVDHDKGHGRIEQRTVSVLHDVDWLNGDRRFPGEHRFPDAATHIRVQSRAELSDRSRFDPRFYISSAVLTAQQAAEAVRAHWGVENSLHWVLDVDFHDDQSRLRKGHGAQNMALARHFAINLARSIKDKRSIKLRRKLAGWDTTYLASILNAPCR